MIPVQTWIAENYHTNSLIQQEAAEHLISLLSIKGHEYILDVGCGDGKITAAIAQVLEKGSILGIDLSKEMVKFAKNRFLLENSTTLDFFHMDAQSIKFKNQFDIIFSSFALQWVPNIDLFFKKAFEALKKSGRIAFTLPFGPSGISDALEKSLSRVTKDSQWNSYFDSLELNYYLHEKDFIENLILKHAFTITHFEVVDQKWQFDSRYAFESYVTAWLPHLKMLPKHLQELFFKQVIDCYLEFCPVCNNGKLDFEFQRIDLVAERKH